MGRSVAVDVISVVVAGPGAIPGHEHGPIPVPGEDGDLILDPIPDPVPEGWNILRET